MTIDISNLPLQVAIDMVKWCYDHDVDKQKCAILMNAITTFPVPDVEWTLDVPEMYSTMFALKWL